jgi:RND family efflux transporter MFP subunit
LSLNDVQHVPDPAQGEFIARLQAEVMSQADFASGAAAFATQLALALGCDRASVGMVKRRYARVVALSHGADVDARRGQFAALAAAMDEAIEQAAVLVYPVGAEDRPRIVMAHADFAARHGVALCTVPLARGGRIIGAVTLERKAGAEFSREDVACAESVARVVGPLLDLMRVADLRPGERLVAALENLCASLFGAGHVKTKLVAGGTLVVLALLTLVPVTYRVSAPARLEGLVQRVMAAPIDGFMQQVHVRPGDRVKAGQVLLEMAAEDIRLEHRRWSAELAQHENAYGAALARGDRAQLVIHQAKAAESRAQLEHTQQRLDRIRIEAPFDGVVLKGDLTQNLGAPVQRGEALLTLAPSAALRLMVEVDERDIALVKPEQPGQVVLAALPGVAVRFTVERVTPMAGAAEGRQFFEVEARLESPRDGLRPGLKGVAKIDAGRRSTAWIWSHRLVDWLRLAWWSAGG